MVLILLEINSPIHLASSHIGSVSGNTPESGDVHLESYSILHPNEDTPKGSVRISLSSYQTFLIYKAEELVKKLCRCVMYQADRLKRNSCASVFDKHFRLTKRTRSPSSFG